MKKRIKYFGIGTLVMIIGALSIGCVTFEPPNTSIEGVWSRGDVVVTISGNTAVFTQFNQNYAHLDLVNNGMINAGDQQIRNIRQAGNLRWTCEFIFVSRSGSNVQLLWEYGTITMAANGRTIQVSAGGHNMTYTRVQ